MGSSTDARIGSAWSDLPGSSPLYSSRAVGIRRGVKYELHRALIGYVAFSPFPSAAVEAIAEDDLGLLECAEVAARAVRRLDSALVA